MKQTPIQEAITIFKDAQKHIISNTEYAKGYDGAITDVITNLEKLLEKEEQEIEDACNAGLSGIPRSAKDYYNETFKQK